MFFGALVLSVEYIFIFHLKGILNHNRYLMTLLFFYVMCLTFLLEGTLRFSLLHWLVSTACGLMWKGKRVLGYFPLFFNVSEARPLPGMSI